MPGLAPPQFATPSELLLLRSALIEGPPAAESVKSWFGQLRNGEASRGFQGLGPASRRLLPLVYRNLKSSIPEPLRGELSRVHHEYWADNQKRLRRLQALLPLFEASGVPTLVLKGMALSILHYRDMALRPMSDLDILVPEEQAQEVVGRLQREGWTVALYLPSAPKKRYFYRHIHAIPLEHPEYGVLDVHWHALTEATFHGADKPFWNDSVPLIANNIKSRALNPTDLLLHVCVHGFATHVLPQIRWIADSVTILRTSQIDWARLLKLATGLHVAVPLAASLSFLREAFSSPIPEDVVWKLRAAPVDDAERRYFGKLVHRNEDWREVLAYNLERHRRANRDRNPIFGAASFASQLQLHYNLPHLKDLGMFAFNRLGKRIRDKIGRS